MFAACQIYCRLLAWTVISLVSADASPQKLPSYPRQNTVTWYSVDANWPQRPKHVSVGTVCGVAVDAQNQIWMATRSAHPVQVYDAQGHFIRAWQNGRIRAPHQLRIDREGNVWIADVDAHVVMKFTPHGELLLELGTRDNPGADAGHFNMPTDMAIASNRDIYVSDGYGNARIVQLNERGVFIRSWGKMGVAAGDFSLPHAIAIDSADRLYVADRNNVRIQVFDREGRLLDHWSNLVQPWGLWMAPGDELWVCGASPAIWENAVRSVPIGCPPKDQLFMLLDTSGKMKQLWMVPKGEDGKERPGELNWVHCLALDTAGNIYAGDVNGRRLQKFVRHAPTSASSN